jgi:hypothetical protein
MLIVIAAGGILMELNEEWFNSFQFKTLFLTGVAEALILEIYVDYPNKINSILREVDKRKNRLTKNLDKYIDGKTEAS